MIPMMHALHEGANLDAQQLMDATCTEHGWSQQHCGMCIRALKEGCYDTEPEQPLDNYLLSSTYGYTC